MACAKPGALAEKNSLQDFSRLIQPEFKSRAPVVKVSGAKVN